MDKTNLKLCFETCGGKHIPTKIEKVIHLKSSIKVLVTNIPAYRCDTCLNLFMDISDREKLEDMKSITDLSKLNIVSIDLKTAIVDWEVYHNV